MKTLLMLCTMCVSCLYGDVISRAKTSSSAYISLAYKPNKSKDIHPHHKIHLGKPRGKVTPVGLKVTDDHEEVLVLPGGSGTYLLSYYIQAKGSRRLLKHKHNVTIAVRVKKSGSSSFHTVEKDKFQPVAAIKRHPDKRRGRHVRERRGRDNNDERDFRRDDQKLKETPEYDYERKIWIFGTRTMLLKLNEGDKVCLYQDNSEGKIRLIKQKGRPVVTFDLVRIAT